VRPPPPPPPPRAPAPRPAAAAPRRGVCGEPDPLARARSGEPTCSEESTECEFRVRAVVRLAHTDARALAGVTLLYSFEKDPATAASAFQARTPQLGGSLLRVSAVLQRREMLA
jgi:hypothetical protein